MTRIGVGDTFQEETKYERGTLRRRRLNWLNKPPIYKRYPEAHKVTLPDPVTEGGQPLWEVIRRRRSRRQFLDEDLDLEDLSQLLWASQGISKKGASRSFRTAPSAGALYPIETYLVVHAVDGLEAGVYHYGVERHLLDTLRLGDFRERAARAALDQTLAARANVLFLWTAVFERSKWKYEQRAYRYVYLDAGHIAQNMALAAVALGLGSCQIAALYDHEANDLVGADGVEESAIYMTVVGRTP